jgi:glycosyltransferase involved in cell wall biosynthesis
MKIFTLPPNENWICDRFAKEWKNKNPKINEEKIQEADIIWLLADWCWNQVPIQFLKSKKVCASVHHIVPDKFNHREIQEWLVRDQFVDFYHVPCLKTKEQIESLTKKPIYVFPFWTNSKMWKDENKNKCREELDLPKENFIIGSFQRDTEGSDLVSPKLEKGPDLFVNTIVKMQKNIKNLHVLLGGWRRQFVISKLKEFNIPYTYIELPDSEKLNKMYNSLDLYLVTARYEGGPQAIVECGLNKTPIVSTDVGLASELMSKESVKDIESILDAKPNVEYLYSSCLEISMSKKGMDPFLKMFEKELK